LEVYVASTEEVFEVMRRGGNARVVAYTSKPVSFLCFDFDLFGLTHRCLMIAFHHRHER
jgi:hypothetical protein